MGGSRAPRTDGSETWIVYSARDPHSQTCWPADPDGCGAGQPGAAAVVRTPVNRPEAGPRGEGPAATLSDKPAEQGFAADRFQRQLEPSVAMTSDVKSEPPICFHGFPPVSLR